MSLCVFCDTLNGHGGFHYAYLKYSNAACGEVLLQYGRRRIHIVAYSYPDLEGSHIIKEQEVGRGCLIKGRSKVFRLYMTIATFDLVWLEQLLHKTKLRLCLRCNFFVIVGSPFI